jgi:hypothetical protein
VTREEEEEGGEEEEGKGRICEKKESLGGYD